MGWLIIIIYVIIAIAILVYIIYKLSYKNKAIWLNVDTDQEGKKAVTFVEKQKSYRIIKQDGKTKAQVPGFKEKIPFSLSNLNPSHFKNRGAVLVNLGEEIYFADVQVNVLEEKDVNGKITKTLKAIFKPIPYDKKANYAETVKRLHTKFTPNKYYLIAGGIVVVAMIISFLMVYFTTDHLQLVIGSAQDVATKVGGLSEQIGNLIAPN